MRRILVDFARARGNQKRGGGAQKVTLDEALVVAPERSLDLLAIEEALRRLEATDARKCRVVELRILRRSYSGGDRGSARGIDGYGQARLARRQAVSAARDAPGGGVTICCEWWLAGKACRNPRSPSHAVVSLITRDYRSGEPRTSFLTDSSMPRDARSETLLDTRELPPTRHGCERHHSMQARSSEQPPLSGPRDESSWSKRAGELANYPSLVSIRAKPPVACSIACSKYRRSTSSY